MSYKWPALFPAPYISAYNQWGNATPAFYYTKQFYETLFTNLYTNSYLDNYKSSVQVTNL